MHGDRSDQSNGSQFRGSLQYRPFVGNNTQSKMNMQAQAGSFNIGDANVINNAGSGLLTAPIMSDSDAADVVV